MRVDASLLLAPLQHSHTRRLDVMVQDNSAWLCAELEYFATCSLPAFIHQEFRDNFVRSKPLSPARLTPALGGGAKPCDVQVHDQELFILETKRTPATSQLGDTLTAMNVLQNGFSNEILL